MDNEQIVTTSEVTAAAEEKYLPQTEVNRIVGREKAATAEKVRRELEAQYAVKGSENSGASSLDPEKIYEEAARRVKADLEKDQQKQQEHQQTQAWNATVKEYNAKLLEAAKSSEHADYDEVMKGFDHAKYNYVVYSANNQENTADIIYELGKRPEKRLQLELLGRNGDLEGLQTSMKAFADSVKTNKEAAKKAQSQSAPLSRVKSDVVTTGASNSADEYLAIKNRYYGRKS